LDARGGGLDIGEGDGGHGHCRSEPKNQSNLKKNAL
jgi:hypothetical protein